VPQAWRHHVSSPKLRRRPVTAVTAAIGSLALIAVTGAAAPAASAQPNLSPQPDQTGNVEDTVLDALETKDATDVWVRFEASADTSMAATTSNWMQRGQQVVDT